MQTRGRRFGFTLIELLVVVGLAAVVLTIAAPSFHNYIVMQRLKGTSAQLTTDLQLARAEAATRQVFGRVAFSNDATKTCYVVYALKVGASDLLSCDCRLGTGAACAAEPQAVEIRVVQVDRSSGIEIVPVTALPDGGNPIGFDAVTGALYSMPTDDFVKELGDFRVEVRADAQRSLRTEISRAGRPSVCGLSANLGQPAC